jgi:hypothetical protein
MSYDEFDARRDQFIDELSRELYPEHREQAIDEFTTGCLQRFYLRNPNILIGPLSLLQEAGRLLLDGHFPAALFFGSASVETLLKSALLKPLVCGLVHADSLADVLASSVVDGVSNLDRLRPLLFGVIAERAGIQLSSFKRSGSSNDLWNEIRKVQELRNAVLHRGEFPTQEDARLGVSVAEFVLDFLFPAILRNAQLHLHGNQVCSIATAKICSDRPLPAIPTKPPVPSGDLKELFDYLRLQDSPLQVYLRNQEVALHGSTLRVSSRGRYLMEYKAELEKLASDFYRQEIVIEFTRQDSE